ncbi:TolC family protein [Clostridium neonatale]|uniref:TolC family protein n=1 Tax=Clostridium neonatale TaxID=137838 RepID=UPI00291BEB51|nr:TolC family protein [Clostridium neonatale]CAI3196442.1 Conserved hypothetical protein [Clostridium neonatale]
MKKNISLLIALALSVSLAGGNCISVSAIEKSDFNVSTSNNIGVSVITLDRAIDAAISNSDSLKLKSKEIKYYKDKLKLQEYSNDFYEDINDDDIDNELLEFSYDKLEIQKDQSEATKNFLKDQITADITDKYNAIILKEIEIENLKKSFEIINNELFYLKAKVQIGKAKSNDLEDKEIEVKSLKDSITAKENSLSINKEYFGVLTNLNTSNCIFDRSVNYNKFKIDGSIDNYIDEKLDEYLHYNEEILNLTEDTFNEVKDDGVDDILDEDPPSVPDKAKYVSTETDENGKPTASFNYGGYALGMMEYQSKIESYIKHLQRYESYLDGKYSIDEGKVKLEDSKKKLKNGLKESYAALLDLENTIDNLSDTVNSTNKKLEFAKASVENGLMTENDYNSKVLSAKDLESNLRKLVNTHDKLKNNIEKPWTLSSN